MKCFRALPLLLLATSLFAQPVDPQLYAGMRWRLLGPFRGGKSTMVAGVPGNPAVYYMSTAGSGVWKTVDGGRVWNCVSDSVRLTSVGAVEVAPSRPETVYAGASGLYRSTDAGAHWDLVALEGHNVSSIVIDPHNADLVMAAAADTGVVRSTDGGKTWTSVLPDEKTGAVWLTFDPDNPKNVYAGTRPIGSGGRGGGGGRGAPPVLTPATDSQIYRSRDEGVTWTKISPSGLPGGNFGTISLAVAPGTNGDRVYDYVAQGMFRSDDGGDHWTRATDDPRLIGGGQFHDVIVDPRDPNTLFATQTSLYRSTDAGKTWESFTGAPSGADFNYVWIDPLNDRDMILAVDQGTIVSMDAGRTWTSWFNQATGQMYNVSTDHGFPFFLYSAQQDSGTIATPIFGRGGEITYRDWYTTNGFESARIVPDPVDANYLYATGWYGSILRIQKSTGQTQHIFEKTAKYRENGSPPMGFSPLDPRTFYLATQFLLSTRDHGMHWETVSPDLTTGGAEGPPNATSRSGGRGGGPAISALAFSPKDAKTFWAATNNGLIQLTRDGGANWTNVAPADLGRAGIASMEASSSDPARAFAVVSTPGGARGAATKTPPRLYRTDDYGQSWKLINAGLPNSVAWVLREDPENRNLVFAALDAGVFVSFNGGDQWQSLELNLPAAWCRDLAIEQNDLIVATYGRALWAIDNISPLRDLAAHAQEVTETDAYLYTPAPAIRMQWDTYTDTPLNPDVPAAENPPDGAIIDYYLKSPADDLKLEVYDSAGQLVRAYSSHSAASLAYKVNVPDYWLAPAPVLAKDAGLHRFVWDLRYPDPDQLLYTYYGIHVNYFEYTLADHAIPHNTPWHEPQGPIVLPGQYEIRLTVGEKTYRRPIIVKLDPRLHVSQEELRSQLDLAQKIVAGMKATYEAYNQAAKLEAKPLEEKIKKITDAPGGLGPMNRDLTRLLIAVDQSDTPPASEIVETFAGMCQATRDALSNWADLLTHDIAALKLTAPPEAPRPPSCGQ